MSYYSIKTNGISDRHPNLLAASSFEKRKVNFLLSPNGEIQEIKPLEMESTLMYEMPLTPFSCKKIVDYAIDKNIETLELFLSDDNNDLEGIFSFLDAYLLDKEISVGLLLPTDAKTNEAIFPSKIKKKSRMLAKATLKNEMFLCCETPRILDLMDSYPLDESFYDLLLRYLRRTNKSNAQIYTDGGLTRQVFSKIISDKNYSPKKSTIISLAIGLELDLDDALTLLNSAGYTLSSSILFDSIIKDFLGEGNYDLRMINETLNSHNLPLLGWKPR